MKKQYMKVEYVVYKISDGGFAYGAEVDPGTSLVQQRGLTGKRADQITLKREDQMGDNPEHPFTKNCIANYIPGLVEATTIVHIPTKDFAGDRLPSERWNAMFLQACSLYGAPVWSASSVKHVTFYMVKLPMWWKLAKEWDLKTMGHRFAAYIGLLFSEMTDDEPLIIDVPEILPEREDNDGVDGNCLVNSTIWGNVTQQFRAWRVNPITGMPNSIGKGIAIPLRHIENIQLNTSQIKMGAEPGRYYILRNHNLRGRLHRVWVSAEPTIMLRNVSAVRQFLMKRVIKEVTKLLMYLTPEHRVDLLRMLGGLHIEDGELEKAKRGVIDMLRSDIPWCAEVEHQVVRFMIRLITKHIVPSGGIYGWSSTLVISDEYGVAPCAWEDAKCFAIRIPTTGYIAIVPLPKNPYKKNRGHVVTLEVAIRVSGDADGDELIVVTDPYVVALYKKYLNKALEGGVKPNKQKYISELCPEVVQDIAMDQVANAWMVGTLTTKAWALIEAGEFKAASLFLEAANVEPMTYKHKITFYGQPFKSYVFDLLKKYEDFDVNLEWRDKRFESEKWNSVREMADAMIDIEMIDDTPRSLLSSLWNAGCRAVYRWNRKYPMKQLSLSKIQRLVFAKAGREIPGAAYREMRVIVKKWGKFWTEHIDKDGNVVGDVDQIYEEVREWAKTASPISKAALLAWRPKQGDGFALKFNAIFATGEGDGVKLLGYHPDVKKYLIRKTEKPVQESILFGESKVRMMAEVR